tara:strand:+ start:259 stop:1047 length:789 start_codon:yes stop_codon:yes gene_type:complete
MKLFEINNIIIDFSISVNNFGCINNEISGQYFEINHRYVNYKTLYSKLPLYYDNIDELDDGIYVWMLLTCDYDDPRMFITQTQNINELGTKHSNIINRLNIFNGNEKIFMHYAGELEKENNNVKMNFSSGSYMRDIFEDNIKMNALSIIEYDYRKCYINDILIYLDIEKYNGLNIKFTKNDNETLITKERLPLKIEHLNLYKESNCEILRFYSLIEGKQYIENRIKWQRFYYQANLYEINKRKYDFLNPPERPAFKFEGEQF